MVSSPSAPTSGDSPDVADLVSNFCALSSTSASSLPVANSPLRVAASDLSSASPVRFSNRLRE